MTGRPTHSAEDLGVFFADWHGRVADIAADFAATWPVPLERDDNEATRAAALNLAQAGLGWRTDTFFGEL